MFSRYSTRRSPWLRAFSLASACALVLAGSADAYGLHKCAHHDLLPGQSSADPVHGGAQAPHDNAAHGEISDAAAVSHGHHPSAPGESHDGACTCVGDCAGSAGALAPETAPETQLAEAPFVETTVAHPSDSPRPTETPHFLPFAQAPPLDR